MADRRSLGELLHSATHRVPGVPRHRERDGHHGRAWSGAGRALNETLNRREPRVLAGWQRRIAALVGHR
jgi:hypothetical protein